jgi:hypothetical protein
MSSFRIDWFDGTTASVHFSDGPKDMPFSIYDCPMDSKEALVKHIRTFWEMTKPLVVKEPEAEKKHPLAEFVGVDIEIPEAVAEAATAEAEK